MDQLDKDAKAAWDMRMSYGKYMANVKPKLNEIIVPEPEQPQESAQGMERHGCCVLCGNRIPPAAARNRKYCGKKCAEEAYRAQRREADVRRRAKARKG